MELKRLYW